MSTDLEIRNVVVVQGRGGVGWAGQEMGIPNLGCSQLVGQGGQATLPQWGYCSSEWEWEPGAKWTQSWAASRGGLVIMAGPFHHLPLPCLAFVTHTRSPAQCWALPSEPP